MVVTMIMFSRYIFNFLMLAALSDLSIAKTNSRRSLRGAQIGMGSFNNMFPVKRRRRVKKNTSIDQTLNSDSRVPKGNRKGKVGIQSPLSETLQNIDGQIEEAFSHQGIINNHSNELTHVTKGPTHEPSSMNTQNDSSSIRSDKLEPAISIHAVSETLSAEPSVLNSNEPSISPSGVHNDPNNRSDTAEPTTFIYDGSEMGNTGTQPPLSETLQNIDGQIEEAFSHQGTINNYSNEPTHVTKGPTHEPSSLSTQNDAPSIRSDKLEPAISIHADSETFSTEPSVLNSNEPSISPSDVHNDPNNRSDTAEPTTFIYGGSEMGNTEPTTLQSNEPSMTPPSIYVTPEMSNTEPSIFQSNKPSTSPSLSPSNTNITKIDGTRSPTVQQIACIDKQTYGCDITLQNCCEGICREDVGIDSEIVTLCFPMKCFDLHSDGCDTNLQNCCEGFCSEVDDLTKDSMKTTKCQIISDDTYDAEASSPHLTPPADPHSETNPNGSPLVAETNIDDNPDTAQSLSDNCIQLNAAGCQVESQNCCTGVCQKCEELGVAICLESAQEPSSFPSKSIDRTSTPSNLSTGASPSIKDVNGVEVTLAPSPGIVHSLREPPGRTTTRPPTISPTLSMQPSTSVSEESSSLIPSLIPSQFPSSEISRNPSLYPTSTRASVQAVTNSKFQTTTNNDSVGKLNCVDMHAYGCNLDTQNCCGDGICIDEIGLTLCVGKLRREHFVKEEVDTDEIISGKEDELCITLHDRGCNVTAQNCCHGVCRKHNGFGEEPITQCDFL